MGWLRSLKYIFSGGRRRWFLRRAAWWQKPHALDGPPDVAALLEVLEVGLQVAPEQAMSLSRVCEARLVDDGNDGLTASTRTLFALAGKLATGPAWRVGWTVARGLKQPGAMAIFSRGLSEHIAGAGDAEAMLQHLDECHRLKLLDRETLEVALNQFVAHQRLQDNPGWALFLRTLPEAMLPAMFQLHALLGRSREAVSLARTHAEKEEAIRLCLQDNTVERLQEAAELVKTLSNTELHERVNTALGESLAGLGKWTEALAYFQAAGNLAGQSRCHEHLGNVGQALRMYPGNSLENRLRLIGILEKEAVEAAARGEWTTAMAVLTELRTMLAGELTPSPAWLERRGAVERHRAELLTTGRQAFQALSTEQAAEQRRDAVLAWVAFEEAAEAWGAAALLLEQSGAPSDRMRASQLWERDKQYGEAIRTLSDLAGRAEVQLRVAELRESGGDMGGAAALFEHLGRWTDAQRTYTNAQMWSQAARCFRQAYPAAEAARSGEYVILMVRARRVDEVVRLCLDQLEIDPRDRSLLNQLRVVLAENGGEIREPRLREAAVERLSRVVEVDLRRRFEAGVGVWIEKARREVEPRFSKIWGMDLGTSKSAVAVYDLQRDIAEICLHQGKQVFSSTLALDKGGNELIGLDAQEQLRPDVRGCIERSKRKIGTGKSYKIGERTFRPEEVAARLMTHGRGLAEAFLRDKVRARVLELARVELGEAVPPEWIEEDAWIAKIAVSLPEAVVTIPAYFDANQRQATKDAGQIAGIKVRRLIAEPTAACLSNSLTRQKRGNMLVVDLGAGTLDLSYLEVSEKLFEVKKNFGDTNFGSSEFDAALNDHFIKTMKEAGLGELSDLDRRRLRAAAEEIKIDLSSASNARVELVGFAGRERYTLELSAARQEEIVAAQLKHLEDECRKAAGLKIDHLVLVGGPMSSPAIRGRIESIFKLKADAVVDPRTAAALGAACQGAILSDPEKVKFILLDVVPFALGILVKKPAKDGSVVRVLIPRDTTIPTARSEVFTTDKDNQRSVTVQVYQGLEDDADPGSTRPLARFNLDDIAPDRAGEPKIEVRFCIDVNGLLEVTAKDQTSGKSRDLRLDDTVWLSPAEREQMNRRLTRSRDWSVERSKLKAMSQRVRVAAEKIEGYEREGVARAWQRQFAEWQRALGQRTVAELSAADHAVLGDMYNSGQASCEEFVLEMDRARSVVPRCQRFVAAVDEVQLPGGEANVQQRLQELSTLGRQLDAQTGEALADLEKLVARFRRWNVSLAYFSTLHADPLDRLSACHEAGDWQRALDSFEEAFVDTSAAERPLPAVQRQLDCLARLGLRKEYRQALAEQVGRLSLLEPHTDRLNEFGRHVVSGIAWVRVRDLGAGSGFLVGPNLVVTNRHVVCDGDQTVEPGRIVVRFGEVQRAVKQVRLPGDPAIDLAVLELVQALEGGRVARVGYSKLMEVGERVFAMGFPLSEGDSFEENLLIDGGIINRIRKRADERVFELSLRIAPGMSGGPVFNDRGEVVAVSTFLVDRQAGGRDGQMLHRSFHAIGVDALHDLLPSLW